MQGVLCAWKYHVLETVNVLILIMFYSGGRHRPFHHEGPQSFRQFMAKLPDHITPDAAKLEYESYLSRYYGDALRAEFEQKKGDPSFRRQFDPRELAPVVERRDAAAQEKAREGTPENAEKLPPGPLPPPTPPGGGTDDQSEMKRDHPRAPLVVWEDGIMAADLTLARQLTRKVDAERGIADNPLAPPLHIPSAAPCNHAGEMTEPTKSGEETTQHMDTDNAIGSKDEKTLLNNDEHGVHEQSKQEETVKDGDAKADALDQSERYKKAEAAEAEEDAARPPEERQAMLDSLLCYLWAIHGIDFYGGKDYADPDDPSRATVRMTLRPEKRPQGTDDKKEEEGGEAPAAVSEEKNHIMEEEEKDVDEADRTDRAKKTQVEDDMEGEREAAEKATSAAAVEESKGGGDKDDNVPGDGAADAGSADRDIFEKARKAYQNRIQRRWMRRIENGDPLTRLLQREKFEAMYAEWLNDQIIKLDEEKWANKLSEKKFKAREFVVKHIHNKHQHVVAAEKNRIYDEIFFLNFKAARDEERSPRQGGWDGSGRGRFMGGRGRGRGGRMGQMAPMMMMNVGAPVFVPSGGRMGGMTPVFMTPMVMPMGRGGRGGGRGRGGYGSMMMPPSGGGQYRDLDNPKNNRAVLDYGDL